MVFDVPFNSLVDPELQPKWTIVPKKMHVSEIELFHCLGNIDRMLINAELMYNRKKRQQLHIGLEFVVLRYSTHDIIHMWEGINRIRVKNISSSNVDSIKHLEKTNGFVDMDWLLTEIDIMVNKLVFCCILIKCHCHITSRDWCFGTDFVLRLNQ
jgi:hypothetical protein